MRIAAASSILASFLIVGCSDSDDPAPMNADASGNAAPGVPLVVPLTVTMGSEGNEPVTAAQICEGPDGRGVQLLDDGTGCGTGFAENLRFLNMQADGFDVFAGHSYVAVGEFPSVLLESSSAGTLTGEALLMAVPESTSTTLVTNAFTITFAYTGNELTISEFTEP